MLRIRVPATSANLGSGFDCMGLALPICNEIAVRAAEELVIHTDAGLPTDERNLIVRSMKSAYERMGRQFRPVELWQTNGIPSTSGLGSSAACIVAGIVAANEIEGGIFSEQELLDLATDLDGHPDNVAPALLGGIVASVRSGGHVHAFRASGAPYRLALLTPDFPLSTRKSRAVLPATYTRADVVATLTHAVTTFAALAEGNPERLSATISDVMHEPYRMPLIRGGAKLARTLRDAGAYATYLSGAGPTIAAFVPANFEFAAPEHWTLRIVPVSEEGVAILER